MKLLELVEYLKNPNSLENLLGKELKNVEIDLIEIYMIESIALDSQIKFFDAEKIPSTIEIEVDGLKYINLFPLYMAQELVEEFTSIYGKNNLEIAKRLIEYRIKDA
ncbi:MAG: hypothetical protein KF856_16410 [Cyclobacteriaceae bacterium]|nr:hypothetical protein [Cyclobacteriaceae bacterium]